MWCPICDIVELERKATNMRKKNKYRVWVKLEAEYDDIEAENEDEAFVVASDRAMIGVDWESDVEFIGEI